MKDLHSLIDLAVGVTVTTVSDNTATATAAIERTGFEAVEFAVVIGTLADTDATFAVTLTDSDDGVTYTAVDSDFVLGSANFTFADDDSVERVGYIGGAKYVKATVTPTGNSGNATFAVIAIKSRSRSNPTDED